MSLDLIVFQGTSGCNLNCSYCYLPEASRKTHVRMSADVLTRASALILRSSLLGANPTVLWHAGEPLALGLQRFSEAVQIVESNNIHARNLIYSVQTNATLINQAWCDFFKRHGFQVGVSMDGPQPLHDSNRIGWTGKGSFVQAMRGVELLKKNQLRYVGICVLTERSLDYPDEIFDFFVNSGFSSFGFNTEEIEAAHAQSSLLPAADRFAHIQQKYVHFMSRMVERWSAAGGAVYVRELEYLSSKIVIQQTRPGYVPMQDVAQGMKIITVRADGSLVTFSPELASGTPDNADAFVVGHIDELDELEDVIADPRYRAMRHAIASGVSQCKRECGHFSVCGGGWPSNKYFENGRFDCSETRNCRLHTQSLADVLYKHFAARPEFSAAVREYVAGKVAQAQTV